MNSEKFIVRGLIVLAGFLGLALITQNTSYVDFFLVNNNPYIRVSDKIHTPIQACDTVYLEKRSILRYANNSISKAFNKLATIQSPRNSGLYNPFYKSNISFQVDYNSYQDEVVLDIQGDLLPVSECDVPLIQGIIDKTIDHYYPNSYQKVLLNGSQKDYMDILNI